MHLGPLELSTQMHYTDKKLHFIDKTVVTNRLKFKKRPKNG